MRIPETIVEEIMRKADIVEVAQSFFELKKAGDNDFKACCPFHNEKTPSFHINRAKQVYHCFGCGAGGNLITLVKAMVNTDYVGAMEWLARKYGVTIPENYDDGVSAGDARRRRQFHDDGLRLLDAAAGWFQSRLNAPEGTAAREYLKSRGIDDATVARYRIGYAPDAWDAFAVWAQANGFSPALLTATGLCLQKENGRLTDRFRNRLMFSICDELSRVVAFSGRVLEAAVKTAKYVNSPETEFFHKSSILYGLNIARLAFRKAGWALVCEGQLDVIACHRAGLEQAIASQGTAFTEEHVRMLTRASVKTAHLAFDGDGAGLHATLNTIKLLYGAGIQPLITTLPEGEDPDGLFRKGGAEALRQVMSIAEPAIPFAFRFFQNEHPDGTPEARSKIANEMAAVIACIQDDVARVGHAQWLADQLSIPQEIFLNLLDSQRQKLLEESRREFRPEGAAMRPATPTPQVVPMAVLERGNDRAAVSLATAALDLALHYQEAAKQFAASSAFWRLTGDAPVFQALNFLLANTAENEWAESVNAIAQGDWATDTIVSRLLLASDFGQDGGDNAEAALPDMPAQAVADCLKRAESMALEAEQVRLRAQLAQAPQNGGNADSGTDISASEEAALREAFNLARNRKSLWGK